MKPLMATFGICSVLVVATSVLAADGAWDGTDSSSSASSAWNDGYCWANSAPQDYPRTSADTATIDDSQSPPVWPVLDTNRTIGDLIMSGDTGGPGDEVDLDLNNCSLTVTAGDGTTGVFRVDDSQGVTAVVIDDNSVGGGGSITADSLTIASTSNAITVTVSGGSVATQ